MRDILAWTHFSLASTYNSNARIYCHYWLHKIEFPLLWPILINKYLNDINTSWMFQNPEYDASASVSSPSNTTPTTENRLHRYLNDTHPSTPEHAGDRLSFLLNNEVGRVTTRNTWWLLCYNFIVHTSHCY